MDYIIKALGIVLGIAGSVVGVIFLTHLISKVQMRSWLSEIDKHFSNKYTKLKKEEHEQVQKD
jgi:hypothetical protein